MDNWITVKDIVSGIMVDGKKRFPYFIKARGSSKTFMGTAYFLAYIESQKLGERVSMARGYEILSEFIEEVRNG
jgi:hypothetical protein